MTHHLENRFGLWALEVPNVAPLIGFIGLMRPRRQFPFSPCVEISWKLSHQFWEKDTLLKLPGRSWHLDFGK